jgi:16S rRNA (guanine966-N2)-methyltransferase
VRIIAGRFRGRQLKAPKAGARPTTDRTREAIFNLVAARVDLDGARVLDLFAGSGALGLEAISRGAAHVTLVDNSAEALRAIRSNSLTLGVLDESRIVRGDVFRVLAAEKGRYDVVLADPPYDLEAIARLPDLVLPLLSEGGLFVLEHDQRQSFSEHPALETERGYGGAKVSVFLSDR